MLFRKQKCGRLNLKKIKNGFYFGQDKPLDPMNWKEILEIHKKFPQIFISKDNIVPKETKIRIN